MAFLSSMKISASALTATRLRMDVIAENVANINTTRTESGDPFRRKFVVYQAREPQREELTFDRAFIRAQDHRDNVFERARSGDAPTPSTPYPATESRAGHGVRVVRIAEDMSEFRFDYNPSHPDADENGFVRMPNIEVVQEMVDMMAAFRAYEANITALNTFKDMAMRTLEIGR